MSTGTKPTPALNGSNVESKAGKRVEEAASVPHPDPSAPSSAPPAAPLHRKLFSLPWNSTSHSLKEESSIKAKQHEVLSTNDDAPTPSSQIPVAASKPLGSSGDAAVGETGHKKAVGDIVGIKAQSPTPEEMPRRRSLDLLTRLGSRSGNSKPVAPTSGSGVDGGRDQGVTGESSTSAEVEGWKAKPEEKEKAQKPARRGLSRTQKGAEAVLALIAGSAPQQTVRPPSETATSPSLEASNPISSPQAAAALPGTASSQNGDTKVVPAKHPLPPAPIIQVDVPATFVASPKPRPIFSRASRATAAKRTPSSGPTPPNVSKNDLKRLKEMLVKPKEANKVIAHLKELDPSAHPEINLMTPGSEPPKIGEPSRCICLALPEREAIEEHQAHLTCIDPANPPPPKPFFSQTPTTPTVLPSPHRVTAKTAMVPEPPPHSLAVDLLMLPATGPGALLGMAGGSSGAFDMMANVTGTIIQASGSQVGISPPKDRMSVFIYWWGYELAVPPPTIAYLNTVHSISGTFFTFLSTLTIAGGAPELQPFIRYISSFVDLEYKAILDQNKGKGVVLAATWVLPIALVPRPWDFRDPPPGSPATLATLVSATPSTLPAPAPVLSQAVPV